MMAMENRVIRPATDDDIPVIMRVMDFAKLIMRQSGNTQQWKGGYPSETVIASDIQRDGAYIVEDKGIIVSYFACLPSPEPTYHIIYDEQWLDCYCGVIHLVSGDERLAYQRMI
jgi:hypothetical protein